MSHVLGRMRQGFDSPTPPSGKSRRYAIRLAVLAMLCVADGASTHYGMTLGASEVSPLLGWLFSIDLNLGSLVRLSFIPVLTWLLWRGYQKGTHTHFIMVVTNAIIGLEAFCVIANLIQIWLF